MADVRNCELCSCPLDAFVHIWIQLCSDGSATSHTVCALHYAMLKAADTPYFAAMENEYEAEVRRVKGLKPGANYLD